MWSHDISRDTSPTSKVPWWPSPRKKKRPNEQLSSDRLSKPFEEIPMQETACPTSSTLHLDLYKDLCLSMDMPPNKTSSKEWCSSMRTLYPSTPPPLQLQPLTLNHSLSPILTSSCRRDRACHIQFILYHHHPCIKNTKKLEAPTNSNHPSQTTDRTHNPFPTTTSS